MTDILRTPNSYSSLSMKDLLLARDLYHNHLINKPNVVGTAISRYLIRKGEPEPQALGPERAQKGYTEAKPKGERTFTNSEVRTYSWPCVLVVVRKWVDWTDFGGAGGKHLPDDMVPRTLYLPDGRTVPVCVVKAEPAGPAEGKVPDWHWPDGLFGGGMPIIVESQGRDLAATAGCLVSDGHNVYALTSAHVCGEPGEPVYTMARGRRVLIGQATGERLSREDFMTIYPEFTGHRTFVQLDIGLIKLNDVGQWTSQVFGLDQPGALADLNEWNITTRLIEAPVMATGAASGHLEGRIRALFYRYKSVGGYDYVSDFLISPRAADEAGVTRASVTSTRPGDSGTVWHLVTKDEGDADPLDDFKGSLRPIAVQWGGQVFQQASDGLSFALATSLTTACRALDVEVVLDHNVGAMPYWGQVGHYTIASFATQKVQNAALKNFVRDNVDRISFTIAELDAQKIKDYLAQARDGGPEIIVPLADVPDIVWKQHYTKMEGGRDTQWAGMGRSTGPEHPTHYADIDEPRPSDNKTLRELCVANPQNISVAFWQNFYNQTGHTASRDRGLLPFRVWQFYKRMAAFAAAGQAAEFLCAAGILSHYVGDACQPLHGSMYADGYKDQETTITHHKRDTGEEYTTPSNVGAGVHSTYESNMIDRHTDDLITGIKTKLPALPALPPIQSGHDAANAIIQLMERSATAIPPTKLVDAYVAAGGKSTVAVQDKLWTKFGDATAAVMADGARVLAAIWEGAWGGGIPANQLGPIAPDDLYALYTDKNFIKSLDLDHISAEL